MPAAKPTDDEREALINTLLSLDIQGTEFDGGSKGNPDHPDRPARWKISRATAEAWADSLTTLRRSEVPEPSAEEWATRITAAREKAIAKGYTPEHDAKHGIRHLLRWAIDYSRRGKAEDSSGLIAAAIDLAEIAYGELERLRHVTDTMRAVSEALRTRYASDSQAAYFMRQIDAALEAVPPQGEPSDAQVDAVKDGVSRLAGMQLMHRYSLFGEPWWDALYAGIARVALRAAGVTEQRGKNHGNT